MTKVSKVYFGLSRVSSAGPHRTGAAARRRSGPLARRPRGVGGRRARHVDVSTCRHVAIVSTRRRRGVVGSAPASWLEGRVDGDRDPDLAAEGDGERVLELAAQPALELVRVKSSGTAMIAVLSWSVTGSLARSQARWLGWRSSTTPRQAASRSGVRCCSTGVRRRSDHGSWSADPVWGAVSERLRVRAGGPQLCPQAVHPVPPCGEAPSETPARDRRTISVSAGQRPHRADRDPRHTVAADRGRRVPAGNLGRAERNKPRRAAARRSPQAVGRRGPPTRRRRAGLTLLEPPAYRWPVTRVVQSTGAACPRTQPRRGRAVPAETGSVPDLPS